MSTSRLRLRFGLRFLFLLMLLAATFGLGWRAHDWFDRVPLQPSAGRFMLLTGYLADESHLELTIDAGHFTLPEPATVTVPSTAP